MSIDKKILRIDNFFSSNLKFLLKHRNLKSSDVATSLGFKEGTFSSYVTGRVTPKVDQGQIIADYFEVLLDDFVNIDMRRDGVTKKEVSGSDTVFIRAMRDRIIRLEDVIMNSKENKEALERAIAELEAAKEKGQ